MQVMREEEPVCDVALGPLDWFKNLPFEPAASSHRLGWVGLEAARNRAAPASELNAPPNPPPARPCNPVAGGVVDDLRRGEAARPTPAGSISLVPRGSPALWRWSGSFHTLHLFLEPGLVARVGAEAFDLDPARLTLPPLDGLVLTHLLAAMSAVDAELTAAGAGGRLAVESLANVLAVQLIRHVSAPRPSTRRRGGTLPRARLRAVLEYIEEHLDAALTLEQMAAIATPLFPGI
jgi:hypothetical protein